MEGIILVLIVGLLFPMLGPFIDLIANGLDSLM